MIESPRGGIIYLGEQLDLEIRTLGHFLYEVGLRQCFIHSGSKSHLLELVKRIATYKKCRMFFRHDPSASGNSRQRFLAGVQKNLTIQAILKSCSIWYVRCPDQAGGNQLCLSKNRRGA